MDLWLIDAFADRPFAGNPAGVCWVDRQVSDDWMQAVAREMNQAETAFLRPRDDGFELRWFTPGYEVDLCGHATLASAHFLWETSRLDPDRDAEFHTRSGRLVAHRGQSGITLDFPATTPIATTPPHGLLESLGTRGACYRNEVAQPDYLVVLDDPATLRALRPDFAVIRGLEARGVIVTAPGDQGFDFISRFFAPGAGIDEDPVTGSAHCTLTPYWAERLGKSEMAAFQASPRGGRLAVKLRAPRVELSGTAVTVLKGTLVV